jgi:hypothetical protein
VTSNSAHSAGVTVGRAVMVHDFVPFEFEDSPHSSIVVRDGPASAAGVSVGVRDVEQVAESLTGQVHEQVRQQLLATFDDPLIAQGVGEQPAHVNLTLAAALQIGVVDHSSKLRLPVVFYRRTSV